ncbi:MAG: hypothetical protein ACI85L_001981 [Pseudomonadota bacterium]|jgi:hypothetical protein
MIKWLKSIFTYQACTDEIKVTVNGKRLVADLNSLSQSEVVKQQVSNVKHTLKAKRF